MMIFFNTSVLFLPPIFWEDLPCDEDFLERGRKVSMMWIGLFVNEKIVTSHDGNPDKGIIGGRNLPPK